jgi:lipoprotein-anchoring transpeptidase ErfK/SrfK
LLRNQRNFGVNAWPALCLWSLTAAFQVAIPQTVNAQLAPAYEGRGAARGYLHSQKKPSLSKGQRQEEAKAAQKRTPTNALIAVVSISNQRISVYDGDGLIAGAPVSTGMTGHRTPTGIFSVIQKSRWHRSNIYSGAPMPYMQRITWSGVALHAGVLPGYPASHGCIRLPSGFAQQLWGMTRLGARIVVAPHATSPFVISHPTLPVPTMTPAGPAPDQDPGAVIGAIHVSAAGSPEAQLAAFEQRSDANGATPVAGPKLLNPQQVAEIARAKARAGAAAAAKAAREAQKLSGMAAIEARRTAQVLAKAEASLASAEAAMTSVERAARTATTPAAVEKVGANRAAADTRLAEARAVVGEASSRASAAADAASAAAAAAKDAGAKSAAAEAAAQDALRALEPISIFISRKTGRLYVRQRWAPLFDVPVTIRDPERPIGTHLFVAMEPQDDVGPLRWTAVTVPENAAPAAAKDKSRNASRSEMAPARTTEHLTAEAALSRIEIPQGALKEIAERTWTGAALTITDHGLGTETGTYTDFIVLTR